MFERFTERARRAIYFALKEAQGLGSARIDTVHLLLGILREDQTVAAQVGAGALDTIRQNLEEVAPPKKARVSVVGDLPLSKASGRAISLAHKEADALGHSRVDTPHLVLALLRIEDCTAAKLLRAYGMDYDRYRETLGSKPLEEPPVLPVE
jgi:ATP-dependent Clp protease ATP-binding subunit ClpC